MVPTHVHVVCCVGLYIEICRNWSGINGLWLFVSSEMCTLPVLSNYSVIFNHNRNLEIFLRSCHNLHTSKTPAQLFDRSSWCWQKLPMPWVRHWSHRPAWRECSSHFTIGLSLRFHPHPADPDISLAACHWNPFHNLDISLHEMPSWLHHRASTSWPFQLVRCW